MFRSTLTRLIPTMRTMGQRLEHTLPALPYEAKALEPVVSGEIMTLHHDMHHATYVNNLNAAEAKLKAAMENNDIDAVIALQPALRFNGGGHINHSIFWQNLSPGGGGEPMGDLKEALIKSFGSVDNFRAEMSAASVAVQGSGWGWLAWKPQSNVLKVISCPNQDPVQATTGLVPLLGLDVWEHAYYLQYKNRRADYVKEIWNVVNWEDVSERYATAVMQHLGEK